MGGQAALPVLLLGLLRLPSLLLAAIIQMLLPPEHCTLHGGLCECSKNWWKIKVRIAAVSADGGCCAGVVIPGLHVDTVAVRCIIGGAWLTCSAEGKQGTLVMVVPPLLCTLQPDYITGLDLDCLVVGGWWGEGSHGSVVSQVSAEEGWKEGEEVGTHLTTALACMPGQRRRWARQICWVAGSVPLSTAGPAAAFKCSPHI